MTTIPVVTDRDEADSSTRDDALVALVYATIAAAGVDPASWDAASQRSFAVAVASAGSDPAALGHLLVMASAMGPPSTPRVRVLPTSEGQITSPDPSVGETRATRLAFPPPTPLQRTTQSDADPDRTAFGRGTWRSRRPSFRSIRENDVRSSIVSTPEALSDRPKADAAPADEGVVLAAPPTSSTNSESRQRFAATPVGAPKLEPPLDEDRSAREPAAALAWIRNVGALVLLFVGWQLFGTGIAEHHSQHALSAEFAAKVKGQAQTDHRVVRPRPGKQSPPTRSPLVLLSRRDQQLVAAPQLGSLVARLQIPKIGLDQFVVEGTGEANLAEGPGHYVGTALPGFAGNVAIAGHRTTYGAPFNELANVAVGSSLFLTTTSGQRLRYIVRTAPSAVAPTDVAVLDDFGDNRLTLTTCTPEFSAAQRLVVVGELAPSTPPSSLKLAAASDPSPFAAPTRWRLNFPAVSLDRRVRVAKPKRLDVVVENVGWNFSKLPAAIFLVGLMIALGLCNRRFVRRLGRLRGWLLLTPVWIVGTWFMLAAISALVPPNI